MTSLVPKPVRKLKAELAYSPDTRAKLKVSHYYCGIHLRTEQKEQRREITHTYVVAGGRIYSKCL